MAPKIEMPKPPENLSLRAKSVLENGAGRLRARRAPPALAANGLRAVGPGNIGPEAIDKLGVTVKDRWDQVKPNPAVAIEQVAHVTFARLLRKLGLDIEPPQETRGPRRPFTRS